MMIELDISDFIFLGVFCLSMYDIHTTSVQK